MLCVAVGWLGSAEVWGAEVRSLEQARARGAIQSPGAETVRPGERIGVLVHLRAGTERAAVRAFAREHGGQVRYEYRTVLPHVMSLRSIPAASVSALERIPGVEAVRLDEYHPDLVKLHDSTPLVRALQSQLSAAGLGQADGGGVRICVVDTGIDTDHVMYEDRIDGAASYDFYNDDPDPEDDHGHGSHVSGIALGRTGLTVTLGCDGAEPFQGVAPAATLIGVKVLNAAGGGFDSDIIAGIDHCADPGLTHGQADVINLSIGDGRFSGDCDGRHPWADAANAASDAGVVVVAAAGNDGYSDALSSPACGSKVVAVGATYDEDFPNCEDGRDSFTWCLSPFCGSSCTDTAPRRDDLICFSNQSAGVDVAAPGCVTYSASHTDSQGTGSTIKQSCGTSMASPHVAGLAALLLDLDPSLSPSQVREHIRSGAADLGPSGFDPGYGHGRIDVIGSLALVDPNACAGGCEPDPCGDGVCAADEDCLSCPSDCASTSAAACGNGVCEAGDGEDCVSCPADCNGVQSGPPAGRFCCGDGDGRNSRGCGDPLCSGGGYACSDAPAAPSCCGDAVCEGAEDGLVCPADCGWCGDGACDAGEDRCTCASDCGAPPGSELSCSDGVDEDCDGSADCGDADCSGSPACACSTTGDACSSDADCCSGKCRGKPGQTTCR